MFALDDILEVVRKPIGIDLYPGMIVQVTEVNLRSKAIFSMPLGSAPYDQEVSVACPMSLDGGRFACKNVDASVFKLRKDISSSDFVFNAEHYAEVNTIIYLKNKVQGGKSMETYIHGGVLSGPNVKGFSTKVLKDELRNRGFEIVDKGNLVDMSGGPKKIIFNYPATICIWPDGSKTVVKCVPGQEFSEYYGYLACLAKKLYGTNGNIGRIINKSKEYGDGHEIKVKKVDGVQVNQLANAAETVERLREGLKASEATAEHFREELNKFYIRVTKLIKRVPLSRGGKKILMAYMKETFPEIFDE